MIEAHIDLSALRDNARRARELAPNSQLMAVIKANAYGHGMVAVARALHDQVDGFAVARWAELPSYALVADTGLEGSDERFEVEVSVASGERAQARGRSKRTAERRAAKALLGQLRLAVEGR